MYAAGAWYDVTDHNGRTTRMRYLKQQGRAHVFDGVDGKTYMLVADAGDCASGRVAAA